MKKIFYITVIAIMLFTSRPASASNDIGFDVDAARKVVSVDITGMNYDSRLGIFRLDSGYFIPTDPCAALWNGYPAAWAKDVNYTIQIRHSNGNIQNFLAASDTNTARYTAWDTLARPCIIDGDRVYITGKDFFAAATEINFPGGSLDTDVNRVYYFMNYSKFASDATVLNDCNSVTINGNAWFDKANMKLYDKDNIVIRGIRCRTGSNAKFTNSILYGGTDIFCGNTWGSLDIEYSYVHSYYDLFAGTMPLTLIGNKLVSDYSAAIQSAGDIHRIITGDSAPVYSRDNNYIATSTLATDTSACYAVDSTSASSVFVGDTFHTSTANGSTPYDIYVFTYAAPKIAYCAGSGSNGIVTTNATLGQNDSGAIYTSLNNGGYLAFEPTHGSGKGIGWRDGSGYSMLDCNIAYLASDFTVTNSFYYYAITFDRPINLTSGKKYAIMAKLYLTQTPVGQPQTTNFDVNGVVGGLAFSSYKLFSSQLLNTSISTTALTFKTPITLAQVAGGSPQTSLILLNGTGVVSTTGALLLDVGVVASGGSFTVSAGSTLEVKEIPAASP